MIIQYQIIELKVIYLSIHSREYRIVEIFISRQSSGKPEIGQIVYAWFTDLYSCLCAAVSRALHKAIAETTVLHCCS